LRWPPTGMAVAMAPSRPRRNRLVARIGYFMRWLGWLGLGLWLLLLLSGSESAFAAKVGLVCFIVLGGLGLLLEWWAVAVEICSARPLETVATRRGCGTSPARRLRRNHGGATGGSNGLRVGIEGNQSQRNAPADRRLDLCDSLRQEQAPRSKKLTMTRAFLVRSRPCAFRPISSSQSNANSSPSRQSSYSAESPSTGYDRSARQPLSPIGRLWLTAAWRQRESDSGAGRVR
jgi:hypothetical protein